MDEQLYIYFHGEYVGVMGNVTNDMWYMDGVWTPVENAKGDQFTEIMNGENLRNNFQRGEGIVVEYSLKEGGNLHFGLAMGLVDGNITVRMLSAAGAEHIQNNKNNKA